MRDLAAISFVLLAAAVCTSLGFWQLDRLEQRRARNTQLSEGLDLPPLTLDSAAIAGLARSPESYLYRRVHLRGSYAAEPVILRGRSFQGQPGVHLLAPLLVEGSDVAVLINRGWIPSDDAATVDPRPFHATAPVEVEGILNLFPPAEGLGVPATLDMEGHRVHTLARLDVAALRSYATDRLAPFYVQQLPGSASGELPYALPPPPLDEGSHLTYAVQWFGFAATFLIGLVVVAARRRVR
ncbi:SURF1 family protein [soil metagenome]